jgi:uncharacterized protein (TIGR03083 family)
MTRPRVAREVIAADISASREALIESQSGLTNEQWDAMSLCEGWKVRDVVAHLIRLGDYLGSPVRYVGNVVAAGFRANGFQALDARRRAAGRQPQSLIDDLGAAMYEETRLWKLHPWPDMTLAELSGTAAR